METDAMICTIGIYNPEGQESFVVAHTVDEAITITEYGKHKVSMTPDEARAVHRALGVMLSQPEFSAP